MNQTHLINELKNAIGNETEIFSKTEWIDICLRFKFVADIQSAVELFEKFDTNQDGFINIFDIGLYCDRSKESKEFIQEEYLSTNINQLIRENLRSEERILTFFKTIQSQYPSLQKYFEDLLIDIISEISEIKKEYEKLENSYNKEKNVSKEKLKELQDDLESWFTKYENDMKHKLSQYEHQIKSIKSERDCLIDEIEYYKNLQNKNKILEDSCTETVALDYDVTELQTSLRESESVKAYYASKLKLLENELVKKDDELENVRMKFQNACDNCQTLDVNLQNLVYANRKLNDDNDQLRSTLISLSNTNSNKSFNISQNIEQAEMLEAEDSGLSTQIEFGDTDNEYLSINKIRRIHSFISNQNKMNNLSNSCDSDNIESPVHGPFRNTVALKSQLQNKNNRRKVGQRHSSDLSAGNQSTIDEKVSLSSLSSSEIIKMEPERMFKIILAGDSSVGKTSFMLQFCKNIFNPILPSTVEFRRSILELRKKFRNSMNEKLSIELALFDKNSESMYREHMKLKSKYLSMLTQGIWGAVINCIDYNTKTLFVDGRLIALQLWDTAGQEKFRSIVSNYFRRADGILIMYDVLNPSSFLNVRCWIDIIRKSDINEFTPIMLLANKIDARNSNSTEHKCVKKKEGELLAKNYDLMFKEISVKEKININTAIIELSRRLKAREDLELSKIHLNEQDIKTAKKCCSKI